MDGALISAARLPMAAFGLGFARCLGLTMILPLTTRLGLTGMHRAGVSAALSLFMMPLLLSQMTPADTVGAHMALLAVKETLLGFLLGVLFAAPFWAAETAGELIDQQRGSRSAIMPDPISEEENGTTATLFVLTIATIFILSGGMHWLIAALSESFHLWPANVLVPALRPAAGGYLLQTLDGILAAGLVLAAPLLIAMLLAELGLALVGRFAPQLNIFDLSMSVKGLVFIIGLPLYAVFLTSFFRDSLAPLTNLAPQLHLLAGH